MERKLHSQLGFVKSVSETKQNNKKKENKQMAKYRIPVTITVETTIVVDADDKQEALAELYDMKNPAILKHLRDEDLELIVDKKKIDLVDDEEEEEIEADKDDEEVGFSIDDDSDDEEEDD